MAGLFGSKSPAPPPPPPPPPPVPTIDKARQGRDQADLLARRRGARASVLTGPEGVGATPVGVKTLIGS